MRRTKTDPLLPAIESLESALRTDQRAREHVWLDKVQRSLSHVAQAVKEHAVLAEAKDGLLGAMNEKTHSVRPTLDRRINDLHLAHVDLHEHVLEMKERVAERLESKGNGWDRVFRMFRSLPADSHESLRQEGERLVDLLREHKESENKLLMDTINTDIGTGD